MNTKELYSFLEELQTVLILEHKLRDCAKEIPNSQDKLPLGEMVKTEQTIIDTLQQLIMHHAPRQTL